MSPLSYYGAFYFLFASLLFVAYRYRALEQICRILVWLLLTLFSGLRVGVGRDYMVYVDVYTNVFSPTNQYIEPLWSVINPVFRHFDVPLHFWLMAIAGLTYFFIFYSFEKWRIHWIGGILCYVLIYKGFFESMNTIRQTLASAIVFAGAYHLLERRYWRFIPWVIVGFLLHSSAIIGGGLLMLCRWRWSPRLLYVGLLVSLLTGLYLFPSLVELLKELSLGKYALYLEGDFPTEATTGLYRVFLCAFAVFLIRSLGWPSVQTSERLKFYTQMMIFAIFIYNALYIFEPGVRLMLYPFTAVFFIFTLYVERLRGQKLWFALGFLLGLITFSFKTVLDPKEPYASYQTVFDQSLPLPDVPRAIESTISD